jgi:hypothetical protein
MLQVLPTSLRGEAISFIIETTKEAAKSARMP